MALDASGGFGDSILNGIMPVMMVYIGRYHKQFSGTYRLSGGKLLLAIVCGFYLSSLFIELMVHLGHLIPVYDIREMSDFEEFCH